MRTPFNSDLLPELTSFTKPTQLKSAVAFLFDWGTIALALIVSLNSAWMIPLAMLVIGSRQRGLSNLVHDASHGNILKNERLNDLVADWLAALPMFETSQRYRSTHAAHHQHLGTERDPDSRAHERYGYEARETSFGKLIFNRHAWMDSVFGVLSEVTPIERLAILLWWVSALALLALTAGSATAGTFLMLWFGSKASTYHFIRVFAEFLDHTGLEHGTALESTRNLPTRGTISRLFHPHRDVFHLTHHLVPSVPHYNLGKAHRVLSEFPEYRFAHHCDGYFFGTHTALDCWAGRCDRAEKSCH